MIHLEEVDRKNWVACAELELESEQEKFLASNVYTIAQRQFEPIHRLRAIYDGETLVGLLAFCHEDEPEDLELFWLFRFMIDRNHQNRGHGTAALRLLTEEVRQLGGKRLRTMHHPDNHVAKRTYKNFGFKEIGFLDNEPLYELPL